jgi:multiple sugar transport system permease protein
VGGGVEVNPVPPPPNDRSGFFGALAPGGRKVLFALIVIAIAFLFAFPVLWLGLTSLRPASGVYYVHRGTELTIENYFEVLSQDVVLHAFVNSFVISTLATIFSLGVTVTSGSIERRSARQPPAGRYACAAG